jgi:hypothetical protein
VPVVEAAVLVDMTEVLLAVHLEDQVAVAEGVVITMLV